MAELICVELRLAGAEALLRMDSLDKAFVSARICGNRVDLRRTMHGVKRHQPRWSITIRTLILRLRHVTHPVLDLPELPIRVVLYNVLRLWIKFVSRSKVQVSCKEFLLVPAGDQPRWELS